MTAYDRLRWTLVVLALWAILEAVAEMVVLLGSDRTLVLL